MKGIHPYEQYRNTLQPVLTSKCKEFALLGYKDVTVEQLWEYLIMKKWKKYRDDIHFHELVNDVFSVKVGEYMHFKTIEAFKYSQENKGPDFESFRDLFS